MSLSEKGREATKVSGEVWRISSLFRKFLTSNDRGSDLAEGLTTLRLIFLAWAVGLKIDSFLQIKVCAIHKSFHFFIILVKHFKIINKLLFFDVFEFYLVPNKILTILLYPIKVHCIRRQSDYINPS